MRDVGTVTTVVVDEADARAEAFALDLVPQGTDPIGSELGLAALVVEPALELAERDLADHGVEHVLDLAGQQDPPAPGAVSASSMARKVSCSPNTLAVSARVSGVSAINGPWPAAST